MQKNTFHPLATILILVSLALCLPHSVAELRAAASAQSSSEAIVTDLPARQYFGPRRHQFRQVDLDESSAPSSPSEPSPYLAPVPSVPSPSRLETILDQSGIHPEQRHLAESVLGLLTPECLDQLQTFTVLYDHPTHRGLAGKGVILISGTVPDEEFIGLLLHEGLGHYRDITCMTGTPQSGASEFHDGDDAIFNDDPSVAFYRISWSDEKTRKPEMKIGDFVTGYAHDSDNFEDLAESVTYYMTQESAFRQRAATHPILAQKLAWLETYMPKTAPFATGDDWDGEIAWDATKLSFEYEQ